MNKQYRGSRLPYTFSTLNNENKYTCSGSNCSCKYLVNRTSYDMDQYKYFSQANNTDYQNMFKSFKNKK